MLFCEFILKTKKGRVLRPAVLWDFRRRHNLTVPELAEMLGVHKSQISRWETSQRPIPPWMENSLHASIDKEQTRQLHLTQRIPNEATLNAAEKNGGDKASECQNGPAPLIPLQRLTFITRRFTAFPEGVGKLQSPYGLHPFPHSFGIGLAPRPLGKT